MKFKDIFKIIKPEDNTNNDDEKWITINGQHVLVGSKYHKKLLKMITKKKIEKKHEKKTKKKK